MSEHLSVVEAPKNGRQLQATFASFRDGTILADEVQAMLVVERGMNHAQVIMYIPDDDSDLSPATIVVGSKRTVYEFGGSRLELVSDEARSNEYTPITLARYDELDQDGQPILKKRWDLRFQRAATEYESRQEAKGGKLSIHAVVITGEDSAIRLRLHSPQAVCHPDYVDEFAELAAGLIEDIELNLMTDSIVSV